MSTRNEYTANRNDNVVHVTMGGRQTEKRAREFAQRSLEPWEVLGERISDYGWRFRVDEERSAARKAVIDTVLLDLDETDRQVGRSVATPRLYLTNLRDTLDTLEEL